MRKPLYKPIEAAIISTRNNVLRVPGMKNTFYAAMVLSTFCATGLVFSNNAFAQGYYSEEDPTESAGDSPHIHEHKADPNDNSYHARQLRAESAGEQKFKQWMQTESPGLGHAHGLNEKEFSELLNKAKAGDANAIGAVGDAYRLGNGVAKSDAQAVEWYKKAVEKGEKRYYSAIGDLYREDRSQPAGAVDNLTEALKNFTGASLKKDDRVAREWYEKGFAVKDAGSYMGLSSMYSNGLGGLPKDPAQAQQLYKNSQAIKKLETDKALQGMRSEFYEEAARAEGIADESQPQAEMARTASNPVKPALQSNIQGIQCSLSASNEKAKGYALLFDATCPSLTTVSNDQVQVSGYSCKVQFISSAAPTHRLFCNPASPDVMLGDAACNVERAGKGSVYNAFCDKAADDSVKKVSYNGMDCAVSAGRDAQRYTLNCKQAMTATSVTLKLGTHTCGLKPIDSPSLSYSLTYEAYCGGLTEEQKRDSAIPANLKVKENQCDVSAWPPNTQGKDFEVNCR